MTSFRGRRVWFFFFFFKDPLKCARKETSLTNMLFTAFASKHTSIHIKAKSSQGRGSPCQHCNFSISEEINGQFCLIWPHRKYCFEGLDLCRRQWVHTTHVELGLHLLANKKGVGTVTYPPTHQQKKNISASAQTLVRWWGICNNSQTCERLFIA